MNQPDSGVRAPAAVKRFVGWGLVTAGICMLSAAWGAATPAPPELSLAAKLFNDGEYSLALEALEQVPEKGIGRESEAQVVFLRGECLYLLDRPAEAAEHFKLLLDRYGRSPWADRALARLASIALAGGDLETARQRVERLVERHESSPSLPPVMLSLGLAQLDSGDAWAAVATLNRWLGRFSGETGTHTARLGLVRADLALEEYDDAIREAEGILSSDAPPGAVSDAAAYLMTALYRSGRYDALVVDGPSLEGKITGTDAVSRARLLRGIALVRSGTPAMAVALLEEVLGAGAQEGVEPSVLVDGRVALAGAILAASEEPDRDQVYGQYDAALELAGQVPDEGLTNRILNRKGIAAWKLKDPDTAVAEFQRAVGNGGPGSTSAALNLGIALASLERYDEAADSFGRVLEERPLPAGWEWAALGKAECAWEKEEWADCRLTFAAIPSATELFSRRPENLLRMETASGVLARSAWLRGAAALEEEDLDGAGAAFGDLLRMSGEGTRDRSLALLGLAEVADRRGNAGRSALLYDQLLTGLGILIPATGETRLKPGNGPIVEDALYGLAEARRSLGQEEAALPVYEALTVLFPESRYAGGALFARGEILESLGRLEQAMESYRDLGGRQEPAGLALRARRRAARVSERLGRFREAESGMRGLLDDLVGEDVPMTGPEAVVFEEAVRYDLGSLLLTVGRNADAAAVFRRNLERFGEGPGMMRNRQGLARALYNSGEFEEAAGLYEALVRDGGDSPLVADAMLWLGWSHENLGRREDARATWKRLEDRFPASEAAPLAAAAWAQQFETGDPAHAAELWARISEIYQGRELAPTALFRAGLLALDAVRPATAARHFRRYREVYPEGDRVVESFLWEGMAEESLGAWEPAREAYRTFLDRSAASEGQVPDDLRAKALTGLARSLRSLGDPHGAISLLEDELTGPGREDVLYREVWSLLGHLYIEVGRPSSALPAYRKVVAMARGDRLEAEAILSMGECLEEMELPKEAAMEYVKVAYLFESIPDLATVGMIRAAGLFERLGDYREAMRSYRRALELEPTEEQKQKIADRVAWLEGHLGLLELELRERKQAGGDGR